MRLFYQYKTCSCLLMARETPSFWRNIFQNFCLQGTSGKNGKKMIGCSGILETGGISSKVREVV